MWSFLVAGQCSFGAKAHLSPHAEDVLNARRIATCCDETARSILTPSPTAASTRVGGGHGLSRSHGILPSSGFSQPIGYITASKTDSTLVRAPQSAACQRPSDPSDTNTGTSGCQVPLYSITQGEGADATTSHSLLEFTSTSPVHHGSLRATNQTTNDLQKPKISSHVSPERIADLSMNRSLIDLYIHARQKKCVSQDNMASKHFAKHLTKVTNPVMKTQDTNTPAEAAKLLAFLVKRSDPMDGTVEHHRTSVREQRNKFASRLTDDTCFAREEDANNEAEPKKRIAPMPYSIFRSMITDQVTIPEKNPPSLHDGDHESGAETPKTAGLPNAGSLATTSSKRGLVSKTLVPGGAPPNAPTGPAALRRGAVPACDADASKQFSIPVSAAWSHSKTWISEQAQEQAAFNKLVANLQRTGCDKSPFVPKTLVDYINLKAEMKESNKRILAHQLAKKETEAKKARDRSSHRTPKAMPLMAAASFADALSPVLSSHSCFNAKYGESGQEAADWPSLAEFKEEGARRAKLGCGRYLPLPKRNAVDPRYWMFEGANAYNADGSIHYSKKAVVEDSRDFISPEMREEAHYVPAVELALEELPEWWGDLIESLGEDSRDET